MPFIITTKRPCPACIHGPAGGGEHRPESVSRRAVATLDGREVYNALYETPLRDKLGASELIAALPASGGTVTEGDGTVIEVEAKLWREINAAGGSDYWPLTENERRSAIVAFNAKQEAAHA